MQIIRFQTLSPQIYIYIVQRRGGRGASRPRVTRSIPRGCLEMSDFIRSWAEARAGPGGSPRERSPDSLGRVYAVCKMAPTENRPPASASGSAPPGRCREGGFSSGGTGLSFPARDWGSPPPSRTPLALPAPSWRQTEQIDDDHQHTRQEAPAFLQRLAACVWNTHCPKRDSGTRGSPPGDRGTQTPDFFYCHN